MAMLRRVSQIDGLIVYLELETMGSVLFVVCKAPCLAATTAVSRAVWRLQPKPGVDPAPELACLETMSHRMRKIPLGNLPRPRLSNKSNFSSSVVGFQALNHNKQKCKNVFQQQP